MKTRKYKGDFGVSVGAKVPPTAFSEIESLAKALGETRAGVVRLLLLRGLAEYHRDGSLNVPQTGSPEGLICRISNLVSDDRSGFAISDSNRER